MSIIVDIVLLVFFANLLRYYVNQNVLKIIDQKYLQNIDNTIMAHKLCKRVPPQERPVSL